MQTAILIPARRHSSRLPDKMLLDICGKAAVRRVYDAAISSRADRVSIVTDDAEIATHGDQSIRVDTQTVNGTERCALALDQLPREYERICIVAGDETCITPEQINIMLQASADGHVWTAVCHQPQRAVTTVDVSGRIVTRFSRTSSLPYAALGVYVYPRELLHAYYWQWSMTARERSDGVELMRTFEAGIPIFAAVLDHPGYGLNTSADADAMRDYIAKR